MMEDLLLKARCGSGGYPVTSRYPSERSPFPSVAGSSMGDSVASRSAYSLPTITETDGGRCDCGWRWCGRTVFKYTGRRSFGYGSWW